MRSVRIAALAAACLCAMGFAGCTSSTSGTSDGTSGSLVSTPPVGSATADPIPAPTTSTAASSSMPGSSVPVTSSAPPPSSSSAGTKATVTTVARPVDATGAPAAGWTVRNQSLAIDCQFGTPSAVSVSAGVGFCAPSAASAYACWKSTGSTALCVGDLGTKSLNRFRVGAFPPPAVRKHPAPVAMRLADGSACTLRDGGTGAPLQAHPSWVVYYYCSGSRAVFAAPNGTGVDSGDPVWTVAVAGADGTGAVQTLTVASATFVGTAGN